MNPQLTRFTLYAVPAHVFLAPDARVPCPSALLLLLLAGWRALVRHVQQLFTAHAAAHCSAQLIAAHAAALVRYSRSCSLLCSAARQLPTALLSCLAAAHRPVQLLWSVARTAARYSGQLLTAPRSCSLLPQLLWSVTRAAARCSAQLLGNCSLLRSAAHFCLTILPIHSLH
jgi:hypothetical protein